MPETSLEIRLPFVCGETDGAGVLVGVGWPGFRGGVGVGLTGCVLGYLNSSISGVRVVERVQRVNASAVVST